MPCRRCIEGRHELRLYALRFGYNHLGLRASLASGTGKSVGYSYDSAARLQQQTINLAGTSADQTLGFTYNAAGQILTRTASNIAYGQAARARRTRPPVMSTR